MEKPLRIHTKSLSDTLAPSKKNCLPRWLPMARRGFRIYSWSAHCLPDFCQKGCIRGSRRVKNGGVPRVVESLAAQEEAKLVAWRKAFFWMPNKPFLHHVQGELKNNFTCMQATSMSFTMFCSEAFYACLSVYDCAVEKEKDRYYEPCIHAAGDSPGCLFMTLPCLPPIPSHLYPPRPTSTPPSLLSTSLPSSHAPFPPASRPHSPLCVPILSSTFLSLPPPSRPCTSRPSPSFHPPAFPPHPASPHFPSPSYRPPTIPSLLASLHFLLLRIRKSGSCPILLDIGLQRVSVCMFLFSLPTAPGEQVPEIWVSFVF